MTIKPAKYTVFIYTVIFYFPLKIMGPAPPGDVTGFPVPGILRSHNALVKDRGLTYIQDSIKICSIYPRDAKNQSRLCAAPTCAPSRPYAPPLDHDAIADRLCDGRPSLGPTGRSAAAAHAGADAGSRVPVKSSQPGTCLACRLRHGSAPRYML